MASRALLQYLPMRTATVQQEHGNHCDRVPCDFYIRVGLACAGKEVTLKSSVEPSLCFSLPYPASWAEQLGISPHIRFGHCGLWWVSVAASDEGVGLPSRSGSLGGTLCWGVLCRSVRKQLLGWPQHTQHTAGVNQIPTGMRPCLEEAYGQNTRSQRHAHPNVTA